MQCPLLRKRKIPQATAFRKLPIFTSVQTSNAKDVVFIHGLFFNPQSWSEWMRFFSAKGYRCHAPAYPLHGGDPGELRKNIPPGLGKITFSEVLAHLEKELRAFSIAPVLIGHSMGGLFVQKLINMHLGAAGICIDSAPPAGVMSFRYSFLRSNLPVINPLKGNSPCLISLSLFHYAFCNVMSLAETRRAYDANVVPESRNIPRGSAGREGRIDFAKPHAPLLFITGEKDHIIPASLNRKNFARYRDAQSVRAIRQFPGRTHYICNQAGWEEVAGFAAEWIAENS